MDAFSSLIFAQLTVPPGDLIYYVVLAFSVASALQSALNHWRVSEFPQARRAIMGLGILLLAQVLMFACSGLGWQHILDPQSVLPPMDRAFIFLGIVWVTWLFAFPEPNRLADGAITLLTLLVISVFSLSLLAWQQQAASSTYNQTADDLFWQAGSLATAAFGILILLLRRPDGMWKGVVFLTIGAAGHLGQILLPQEGNYSGIVRLAYMAAYPILLTLPQRFSFPMIRTEVKVSSSALKQEAPGADKKRYSTDPKTFHAMLALAVETNPTKVSQSITRAIAQTMLADLCFLIYLTDNNNQIVIGGGYDLIREDNLDGGSLKKSSIPMLANSMQRGRPLRMPSSSTSADIKGLGDVLGLPNPGHLLSVPILTPEKESLGGILLLSPYSDRTWTAEDQTYLSNIAAALVPLIKRNQKYSKLENQAERLRKQVEELETRNKKLDRQLEAAASEPKKTGNETEIASLRAAQEESQRIIEELQKENSALRSEQLTQAADFSREDAALQAALQEINNLKSSIPDTKTDQDPVQVLEKNEVITSISQELRQPLSSIMGYTELLLGESVGILGALQRKFVERIKSSAERIRSLVDDLIQVTTLETELQDLKSEAVDLNEIIDNAMSYTSSQVREKNISMHLELPELLVPIQADREALQQILIHLLQNAGSATPFEGTIGLTVQTRTEDGMDFILIQVKDSGGGIAAEDLPRVFTRLYRADNVLIQGVGDTGVGLSIAKALTEAQHGRIWVESDPGSGSSFSVLLPIAGPLRANQPAGQQDGNQE